MELHDHLSNRDFSANKPSAQLGTQKVPGGWIQGHVVSTLLSTISLEHQGSSYP